jgi:hypothetical protein
MERTIVMKEKRNEKLENIKNEFEIIQRSKLKWLD